MQGVPLSGDRSGEQSDPGGDCSASQRAFFTHGHQGHGLGDLSGASSDIKCSNDPKWQRKFSSCKVLNVSTTGTSSNCSCPGKRSMLRHQCFRMLSRSCKLGTVSLPCLALATQPRARSPLPLNRRCPFFLVLPPGVPPANFQICSCRQRAYYLLRMTCTQSEAKDGRLRDNLAQHVHPELRRVA